MLKTVLLLLLAYIAYRFIFGFIIPVAKTTRQVRRQFKAAQQDMETQMRAQQQAYQNQQQFSQQREPVQPESRKVSKSDYIDFEEIK
ncbi:DUF4834 family protein [Flavihumibacter solisilvae]|uniref:DUF4834 domain-containing protein n=1 Tax=Flavihumibacter solisilvae TaxID=1349421 RepID=A0A0C1IWE8_9BACT|nr:DUF4834 family protein [Flavihumibacter solisilvae]KIC94819.1 hypothetical protein OI18_10180 [Flavihumibacter solisilvae]